MGEQEWNDFVVTQVEDFISNELGNYGYWDGYCLDEEEFEKVQQVLRKINVTVEEK